MSSLTTLIASEASLVQEAALAVPHSFDKCTHGQGPIKQAVHLCLTCAIPRGLCSSCSVACHGDHEQIELFPKRSFVCDCPTHIGGRHCTLHKGIVAGNEFNKYGQNFEATFCRCHRPYDAKREKETMVQCLVCEDWFHESCLNLRTRPNERSPSPDPPAKESCDVADWESNASNDLPPSLLPSSTYDTFICGSCVFGNDTLRRWAGSQGAMMVVREEGDKEVAQIEEGGVDPRWKVLDGEEDHSEAVVVTAAGGAERKRVHEDEDEEESEKRATKRFRAEGPSPTPTSATIPSVSQTESPTPCLAPPPNPIAQQILNRLLAQTSNPAVGTNAARFVGNGDIFLTEGWRERWCRCAKCLPFLQRHPYLLEEEETYEPPEDPDSCMSLEDLGMRALLNLPRDRAIDGIMAYNAMRDELMTYLRPFAQEGRVVREEDVREFFEAKAKAQAAKG